MTIAKQGNKPTILFKAKLLRADAKSWTLTLPKSAKLPRGMVEGTINGFPFRIALEPKGLRVTKAMHDAAGAGDTVMVEITRVGEEPETRVPMDLRKALAAVSKAKALWADITPMARRDWVLWVSSAKQTETRKRRIENACDMLASGKRRPCCFPGINWRTKDHVTPDETWRPLPNSKNI